MHTRGAAHLCHAADRLFDLLRRDEHQVGQLVDDDDDARQLFERFVRFRHLIVGGKVLDVVLGEHLVALHHLVHGPLQRTRGLLRVGDDGDEQVWDAVVGRKLDHLRVDHDKAHLFGRRLIEHRDDQRVRAHGLTGACRTSDEHVRKLRDIPDDVLAADVLANGEGRGGRMGGELRGFEHRADADGRNELVRHLDTHDGDLVGDGRDAHAARAQRKGDIVLQICDLRELHALTERELIARDRRAAHHIARLGVHAETRERLRQAAGVVAQLRARLGGVRHAALF